MASPTVWGMIHGYELPVLMYGGSEIFVMSDEVTREFNNRWKHIDWKTFAANDNRSD
jgi:hypothetical protein